MRALCPPRRRRPPRGGRWAPSKPWQERALSRGCRAQGLESHPSGPRPPAAPRRPAAPQPQQPLGAQWPLSPQRPLGPQRPRLPPPGKGTPSSVTCPALGLPLLPEERFPPTRGFRAGHVPGAAPHLAHTGSLRCHGVPGPYGAHLPAQQGCVVQAQRALPGSPLQHLGRWPQPCSSHMIPRQGRPPRPPVLELTVPAPPERMLTHGEGAGRPHKRELLGQHPQSTSCWLFPLGRPTPDIFRCPAGAR